KPGKEIVEMSGQADDVIAVDRVALRDGFKPLSILRIFQVVKDLRHRQFDFVSNFRPLPPVEENNRTRHQVDRYLDVLRPLGIKDADRVARLASLPETDREVSALLHKAKADSGAPLV